MHHEPGNAKEMYQYQIYSNINRNRIENGYIWDTHTGKYCVLGGIVFIWYQMIRD